MRRYFFLGLLSNFALLAGKSFADAPVERIGIKTEATQVGPEVLAKQMEGKKFYSFEVLPAGELREADGSLIPFHTLLEHLESAKPDKDGFFEFRLSGVQMMNLASVAMDIFRQYGAKNFSVKVPPGSLPPRESIQTVPVTVAVPNERIATTGESLPKTSSSETAAEDTARKEYTLNPESAEKLLAGKQTYNFVVVSGEEFVDQDGRHFSPHAIKAYLEKVKPEKNAVYMFWMRDKSAVEIVKAAIPAFDEYGAVMIVVREMEKAGKGAPRASNGQRPKKVLLVGGPNPEALSARDMAPDMLGRPIHLRPGKLPRRVRYQFKSDGEVVAAAQLVNSTMLDPSTAADAPIAGKVLAVQAGVWAQVSHLPVLKSARVVHGALELPKRIARLESAFLSDAQQSAAVVKEVRSLIAADGGGTCRALRTDEMNQWWTYIGFDIEEPVFMIETNGGHHRFIVACHDNKISLVDDLNGVPTE